MKMFFFILQHFMKASAQSPHRLTFIFPVVHVHPTMSMQTMAAKEDAVQSRKDRKFAHIDDEHFNHEGECPFRGVKIVRRDARCRHTTDGPTDSAPYILRGIPKKLKYVP